MSTDPSPWTALLTALRRIERECITCPCGAEQAAGVARSALASWESRPRLMEDLELVRLVVQLGVDARSVEFGERITLYTRFLDAIDAWLGAPGKGTT